MEVSFDCSGYHLLELGSRPVATYRTAEELSRLIPNVVLPVMRVPRRGT
jgi:hypothetical protein